MELCTIFVALFIIAFLAWFMTLDCDVQLKLYELVGVKTERLRGKVVWITGASSGIGENLAYDLAKIGAKLVLSARREDELQRVKEEALRVGNGLTEEDVMVLRLDMLDYDSHAAAVNKVESKFQHIDVLVNNAGRTQRGLAKDTALEVTRQLLDLNLLSVISLTRAVLPGMLQRGRGHVVCTSSVAGKLGAPWSSSYSASKFALQGWCETLRVECKGIIKVTMCCPGPVHSEILKNTFTDEIGKKYEIKGKDKRMATARCSQLMLYSMAAQLDETWITMQPILLFTYMNSLFPWLTSRAAQRMMKGGAMASFRQK